MQRTQEKRNFVRWRLQKPARYKLPNQEEERMALLRDISFLGAQISILENLRLNEKLDMLLEIPDEENAISCQAKIVWQDFVEESGKRHFVCGVSFTRIEDKDKEKIFKYVWSTTPDEIRKRWWDGAK